MQICGATGCACINHVCVLCVQHGTQHAAHAQGDQPQHAAQVVVKHGKPPQVHSTIQALSIWPQALSIWPLPAGCAGLAACQRLSYSSRAEPHKHHQPAATHPPPIHSSPLPPWSSVASWLLLPQCHQTLPQAHPAPGQSHHLTDQG